MMPESLDNVNFVSSFAVSTFSIFVDGVDCGDVFIAISEDLSTAVIDVICGPLHMVSDRGLEPLLFHIPNVVPYQLGESEKTGRPYGILTHDLFRDREAH